MALHEDWVNKLYQEQFQVLGIKNQHAQLYGMGTLTAEGSMDLTKVVTALAERLGLTIDHKSELVETRPGKVWAGDSFTPSNFSKLREDVDDLQEIVMGTTKYLKLGVTVEDGRKVTVTPPPNYGENEDATAGGNNNEFDPGF